MKNNKRKKIASIIGTRLLAATTTNGKFKNSSNRNKKDMEKRKCINKRPARRTITKTATTSEIIRTTRKIGKSETSIISPKTVSASASAATTTTTQSLIIGITIAIITA